MPRLSYFANGLLVAVALASAAGAQPATPPAADPVVLVVHGGAGSLRPGVLSADAEAALRTAIEGALRAGHAALADGRPALDAVEAVITRLEDDPRFNAGRGAVLAADGTARHDASVMDGRSGGAGASSGTMRVRHPITLARRVMDASPHVLLTADGAETFAREQGLELVENEWFITDDARRTLEAVQQRERESRGDAGLPASARTGTVGAVALDADGFLAAGTSTGGMTNKRWGRIGDSPIVGAGTWADRACGVSATGHGEFFIRLAVAHDIAARVAYLGETCADAARHVVGRTLTDAGGTGGVIALGADGVAAMPFNTSGMSRGTITRSGVVTVHLYADEEGR
jgi:beta-aspartyl-peptidase (threonine type)